MLYELHLLTLWEPPTGELRLLWLPIGLRREPASHVFGKGCFSAFSDGTVKAPR